MKVHLPRAGIGKVKNRDNAALWGTDQEHKMRTPDDPFYKKYAAEASRVHIAVDIFALGCAGSPLARSTYRVPVRCNVGLKGEVSGVATGGPLARP